MHPVPPSLPATPGSRPQPRRLQTRGLAQPRRLRGPLPAGSSQLPTWIQQQRPVFRVLLAGGGGVRHHLTEGQGPWGVGILSLTEDARQGRVGVPRGPLRTPQPWRQRKRASLGASEGPSPASGALHKEPLVWCRRWRPTHGHRVEAWPWSCLPSLGS